MTTPTVETKNMARIDKQHKCVGPERQDVPGDVPMELAEGVALLIASLEHEAPDRETGETGV